VGAGAAEANTRSERARILSRVKGQDDAQAKGGGESLGWEKRKLSLICLFPGKWLICACLYVDTAAVTSRSSCRRKTTKLAPATK
jgi:hypothetical protein